MSKLRVHNLVVSLDGYATGEGQSLDAAFGHAQQAFMEWFGKIRIWRGLQPDGKLGPDEAIASAWGTAIGAEIMGRNKFRPTTGPWPEDGWRGWWGDDPPFHAPCFVMTHYEREPLNALRARSARRYPPAGSHLGQPATTAGPLPNANVA